MKEKCSKCEKKAYMYVDEKTYFKSKKTTSKNYKRISNTLKKHLIKQHIIVKFINKNTLKPFGGL